MNVCSPPAPAAVAPMHEWLHVSFRRQRSESSDFGELAKPGRGRGCRQLRRLFSRCKRRGAKCLSSRETVVAVRSALVFVAMALPLTQPGWREMIPTELLKVYHLLPLWYLLALGRHLGGFVEEASQIIGGGLLGIFGIAIMNAMVSSRIMRSDIGAFFFTALFIYAVLMTRLGIFGKQYAISAVSTALVEGYRDMHEAKLDASGDRTRSAIGVFCFMMLAVMLSGLTLLPWSGVKESRGRQSLSLLEAKQDVKELVADTVTGLDRLLLYFSENALNMDIENSFFYIRELGSRRSSVESLLSEAWWECWTPANKTLHARLVHLCGLLRELRQSLRVQLQRFQGFDRTAPVPQTSAAFKHHLTTFAGDCRVALCSLTASLDSKPGSSEHRRTVVECADQAEIALFDALLELQRCGSSAPHAFETAFVDGLRTWPLLIRRLELQQTAWQPKQGCSWRSLLRTNTEQRVFALRNSISCLLAIFWCLYVRPGSVGCVTSVSFLISESLGSLTQRNFNRMVGMAMGIYIGSLPYSLLMQAKPSSHGLVTCFIHGRKGLLVYLLVMLCMWLVPTKAFLSPGSTWRYAFKVWVMFASVNMMKYLVLLSPVPWKLPSEHDIYTNAMDQFAGCWIIFATELFFNNFVVGSASNQVTRLLPQCLHHAFKLAGGLAHPSLLAMCELHGDALQKNIKLARFWDAEVQKEDPVWSSFMQSEYKADFVHCLLDHCDSVYVAMQAIRLSAGRCSSLSSVTSIVREVVPGPLLEKVCNYAESVSAALLDNDEAEHINPDDSGKHQDPQSPILGKAMFCEVPEGDGDACRATRADAAAAAAAISVRSSAWALQLALQRIEVVIREQAFYMLQDKDI